MVIDPTNHEIIYAGGRYYNGSTSIMAVCKSTNSGVNWTRYHLSSDRGTVYSLAVHPANSDIIIAGGYIDNGIAYIGKILKSTDGGAHWSDASSGIEDNYNYVYALAFHPTSPNTIYAGCSDGIFRSTDGGSTWTNLNVGFYGVCDIVFDMDSPMTLYAASYSRGVYISTDEGQTWSEMNDGLIIMEIECLALDPINKILFAGTYGAGVFRCDISTSVNPISEPKLPVQFALKPNYPNPFNPTTTIIYDIPGNNNSYVSLIIYNISGQMVKTLVDERQQVGQYSVNWDGTNDFGLPLTSGVYICVLTANNYQCIRKITLVR